MQARTDNLPAELADEVWLKWTSGPHRYVDRDWQFVLGELRSAVTLAGKRHRDVLAGDGVGGRWRVLLLRPGAIPGNLQDLYPHD